MASAQILKFNQKKKPGMSLPGSNVEKDCTVMMT